MRRARKILVIASTVAMATTASCNGDDPPDNTFGSKYKGLYQIATFTENTGSCTAEGASILAADRDHLIVSSKMDVLGSFLEVVGCGSVAECHEFHRTGTGVIPFVMEFEKDHGDRLEGGTVRSGILESGTCTNAALNLATLTAPADKMIRMEIRSSTGDYPANSARECTTRDAQQALAGKACNVFRVITATRIATL